MIKDRLHITASRYPHVFGDLVDALAASATAIGCDVSFEWHRLVKGTTNLVLGSKFPKEELAAIGDDAILYNLEQVFPESTHMTRQYVDQLRSSYVWDYSEANLRSLRGAGVRNCAHVPIGYIPSMSYLEPSDRQDIDVLFYGEINLRRREVLERLRAGGLHVVATEVGPWTREQRDHYLMRSKVVLNMHYHTPPNPIFEVVRVSHLLANRKAVVAEVQAGTVVDPDILQACATGTLDELPDLCRRLAADDALRKSRESLGFEIFVRRDEREFLRAGLAAHARWRGKRGDPARRVEDTSDFAQPPSPALPRASQSTVAGSLPIVQSAEDGGRHRIRVVAIARDEAAAIGEFFAQFFPVTSDFCLLDTGSTDGTPDLARAAGARVESASFEDFAGARNEALARFAAGADWIVMLDPDERLDAHTIAHLGALAAHSAHDILLAPLAAVHADGSRRAWPGKPFLFRADAGLRWVFKVHEKLIGSIRQGMVANARIDHVLALHDAPRRAAAERRYEALAAQEPYFVDAAYRQRMRDAWPILDYDRGHDDRLGRVVAGPLVSVVIPTYRRPDLLQRAVRSALAQDYPNLEILVVGDHDPCHAEYAGAFSADPRVQVHNLEQNHGPGGAVPRNRALRLARGDLVAYLDDDNSWAPDHLSSLYEALRGTDAAFAFSSMQVDGTDLRFRRPELQGIDTSCLLHRRELIARYGDWAGFAAGYQHDWELVSRWVAGGERWACTERATLHYNPATSRQRDFILGLAAQRAREQGADGAATEAGGATSRREVDGDGPVLCLNMIVKNEAAIIERLLRSVADVIACCVVGDTGSTDGTPEVIAAFCAARGIACELHSFPFVDFGQARNEALERARRSPLAFDYLLLADADMELCIDAPGAVAGLSADGVLLRQQNGAIAYDNVRLLRRGAAARYIGATHEALVVDGDIVSVPGWRFVDHADGANRFEKLARDERLLRAALEHDPGDTRAMFYLAQTLQEAGRPGEAAKWYERRVAAGGWDEERWYARYRHAQCLLATGDVAGFVAGCLDAYALRPTRAEPLWRLAGHYAERGQRDAALLLFEQVARMPRPDADRLFVERECYGDAVVEAISIHGWYSALPARRDAGRQACEALAVSVAATPQRRATARRNLFSYAQPLASLCPGTRVAAIEFPLAAPWRATNPSFTRDGDGFAGVVRAVNYRLVDGSYDIHDAHGVVRTRNFFVRLAPDLTVAGWREILDLAPLPRNEAARIRGFEDCRLFRWRDAWWCTATARDVLADQRAVMVLLRLDAAGDIVAASPLRGYGDDLHQKNWMPLVDDRMRFVYSLGPTLVLDASAGDGTFIVESGVDPGLAIEHWRGGGPLVPWDAGHLALVHEANDTPQGREYVHRFVALDDRCVPVAATAAFHFHARGVEFAAGLTLDGDALVASYGVGDGSAWVARVPCAAVRARLQPLSRSREAGDPGQG